MALTVDKKIRFGFAGALLVTLVTASAAVLNLVRLEDTFVRVDHTHQVLRAIERAAGSTLAMQTVVRGYVHSGREDLVETYRHTSAEMLLELRQLRELTRDDPAQQRRLDGLDPVAARIREHLDAAVAARAIQRGQFSTGDDLVPEVQKEFEAFGVVLHDMESEENRLLAVRLEATQGAERLTAWTIFGAALCAAVAILGAAVLVHRDNRRRHEAEDALRLAAARFETLYHEAPCGYHSLDADGTIQSINETELRWLGYTREEVVGRMHITEWMTPASAARFAQEFPEFRRRGRLRGVEFDWRRKDGSLLPVIVNADAIYGPDGRYVSSRGTVFDNSAPKRAVQAVQESEERLRLMFAGVNDYGIIMLDASGQVVQWNPGAERIHGYTPAEIVGQDFSRLYPESAIRAGAPAHELKTAEQTGRFEDEGWRVRKDGSTFWANVVVSPLRDAAGNLRGFVKVTRDLTEPRRAQQQIEQLNDDLRRRASELEATNRELESFSYSVSHDLRAPLRHIEGFASLLTSHEGAQLDDEARRYLEIIMRSADRMSKLIDDLLSFSRAGRVPLRVDAVDLNELVASVVEELAGPGSKIDWHLAHLPTVMADGALLRQVWINLLSNAAKYSSKNPHPQIELGVQENAREYAFFVRDNGVGFDMAFADRLFGVFQRLHSATEFEGTGIGLANVRRIVERHGGRVWAEGRPNEGATFYFSLPRIAPA